MQFYLAPLEGVTGHVFREAYENLFHDIDKYFTPFLAANDHLSPRTLRELKADLSVPLIPQILGNQADKILAFMGEIAAAGDFDTINLNFGCPSGTVSAKGRGAGIFKDLIAMDDLLDELFAKSPLKISLKTRIGWADESEWEKIVRIYADYPFSEIIIHPRVRTDQYRLPCRPEAFAYAREHLSVPLCYNGEINSAEDLDRLCRLFPDLDRVMVGRGIVRNPFLVGDLKKHLQGQDRRQEQSQDQDRMQENDTDVRTEDERIRRREFVKALEEGYLAQMQREEHAVMRMKEFWMYFGTSFPQCHQALKAVKKAKTLSEYRMAVSMIPL